MPEPFNSGNAADEIEAMGDPAEQVLAHEKEHADFADSALEQLAGQLVFGAIRRWGEAHSA